MEEVEVAPAEGNHAIFPCYCWLAEEKGDNKMERDILPGEPRPPRPSECRLQPSPSKIKCDSNNIIMLQSTSFRPKKYRFRFQDSSFLILLFLFTV